MGRIGHHHPRRAVLAALLLVPLLFGTSFTAPARAGDPLSDALKAQKALQAKIAAQRQQIKALQASEANLQGILADTQAELNGINADQAKLQSNVSKAQAALADVRAKYTQIVGQVADLDWRLQALEGDIEDSQQALDASRATLAQHIAEAYKVQQTSLLEQLLTAHSLADVLADVGYYLRVGDQDQQLAAQIQSDQQALEQLQRATASTRADTQRARLQMYAQKQEMTDQRDALLAAQKKLDALEARTQAAQARQLATYNKIKQTKAQAAATLAKQQAALNALAAQIARLAAAQSNIPSQYNGTLAWPMPGIVTQEFGCTGFVAEPPLGNCAHFHTGIDIVAPMYSPIRAAGDGTVLFVGPNPYDPPYAWAVIVIIAHSQNLLTWYAHVDDSAHPPVVYKGERVSQGQVIAYEGNTGNSTGAHLDFKVQLNGSFVNPRLFL